MTTPRPSVADFERAMREKPRRDGESTADWFARLVAAALPDVDRQLPRGDREPGEDE